MNCPLIELGELMPGRGASVDPSKFPDEEFALFSVPAYDCQAPDRVAGKEIGSSKQVVQPGDVLLSKIVPHIRRAWIVPESDGRRQIGSSEWIIFRSPNFFGPYLRHVLLSDQFNAKLMQTVSGVGGSLLRARPAGVAKLRIPLPPLDEQRRIAAILDQAEELRAKRRAAIALLDQLPQAIFLEMFGDPASNPKGWQTKPLKAVTTKIGSGSTPTGGESAYKSEGIALIRSMNIHDGQFIPKGLAYIDDLQAAKLSNVVVAPSDVLLNITGASVARVALVPKGVLPARVNQHVSILRCAQELSPRFLESLLINPSTKKSLLRVAGAGATREAITKEQLESFRIPLPPIETQQLFADRVEAIYHTRAAHQSALAELDALFASLQYTAFGGQV